MHAPPLRGTRLAAALRRLEHRLLLRGLRSPGPLDVYFGAQSLPSTNAEWLFFACIQLGNGVSKTTEERRLDEVNELVAGFLPRDRRLRVMDVAVSTGVTAAEWSEQLSAAGIEHELVAGDVALRGALLTVGRRVGVLWQEGGHPLAVQAGDRCFYLSPTLRKTATAWAGPPLRWLYRLAAMRMRSGDPVPPAAWRIRMRRVDFVSGRLRSAPAVEIVDDDITEPGRFSASFDVCRAANILNRSYFSDSELESIAGSLLERLRSGGILVVCRTRDEDGANETSVFRVGDGSVDVVARLNGGSEAEPVVLAAAASRAPQPSEADEAKKSTVAASPSSKVRAGS